MARQLILQTPGFGKVGQQHQLAGLAAENEWRSTDGVRCAGNLMAIILARAKLRTMTSRQLTPPGAHPEAPRPQDWRRAPPLAIDDDHAARKQIQHVPQPLSEPLLLSSSWRRCAPARRAGPGAQRRVPAKPLGLAQLSGKLSETLERAFEVHRIGGLKGRWTAW